MSDFDWIAWERKMARLRWVGYGISALWALVAVAYGLRALGVSVPVETP